MGNTLSWGEIPEPLWEIIQKHLPAEKPPRTNGRPVVPFRKVMNGIYYRLRTGCQWKRMPKEFGSGSTCHTRFQQWTEAGILRRIWRACAEEYERVQGIDWEWLSLDSASVKAPKGGDLTGPNPTDRAKLGTKRHNLTDGRGAPLSTVISGANRHDMKLFTAVLDSLIVRRPRRWVDRPRHLCGDKGYDYPECRRAARRRGYVEHLKERGIGDEACARGRRHPARRWVIERTNGWHNRFRGLLVRYELKSRNDQALVEFANAIICFRMAHA